MKSKLYAEMKIGHRPMASATLPVISKAVCSVTLSQEDWKSWNHAGCFTYSESDGYILLCHPSPSARATVNCKLCISAIVLY
jgi:hypothetical protein